VTSEEDKQMNFYVGGEDLALKVLVRDYLPSMANGSLETYRNKFSSLGDFLVPSARPSCLKFKTLEVKLEKLVSSRSSPLNKTWKTENGLSQCHVSTNPHSIDGEDSDDWCEASPKNVHQKVSGKLLFGAPDSDK